MATPRAGRTRRRGADNKHTEVDGSYCDWGPCGGTCRYTRVLTAADARYRCPTHGRVHVCDNTTCFIDGDTTHPSRPPHCAWTGRQLPFSYKPDWDEVSQYYGGLGTVRNLPDKKRAPVARGELIVGLLASFLLPEWRDAAAAGFYEQARARKLVRFGLPYFPRRMRVDPLELGAFADLLTACPAVAPMSKDDIARNAVIIVRNVCRGTPGFELPFCPYWVFGLAPYGTDLAPPRK